MKTIQEVCNSTKPKDIQKLQDHLNRNNCAMYFQAFKQEVFYPTVKDYSKLGLVVTNSFICDYKNDFFIYPIANIANIYRSTIVKGEYSFTNMNIAIETKENKRFYLGNTFRNIQNVLYNDFISNVRQRCIEYNNQINQQNI